MKARGESGGAARSASSESKSSSIRRRLGHPVIDADAHLLEFLPALEDYIAKAGGAGVAEKFRIWHRDRSTWYRMSWQERRHTGSIRPTWWLFLTRDTGARAASLLPKLRYEMLDRMGIDFQIVYPGLGLLFPLIDDEELRRACCRGYNEMCADFFGDYRDRLTPAAVVPMHTPTEAIEELEHAVTRLRLKVAAIAGYVRRPIPAIEGLAPEAGRRAWLPDAFGIDSPYDYDPVWAKCVELRIAPSNHLPGHAMGGYTSISSYSYNHLGHFAQSNHLLCKSLFFGGVTRRFPRLRLGLLEGGGGWAFSLYNELVGLWRTRGPEGLGNIDPAALDREELARLVSRYGGSRLARYSIEDLVRPWGFLGEYEEDPADLDEWKRCGIERPQDIRDLFVSSFYLGCEADDPSIAVACSRKLNAFGSPLRVILSSDIGHYDVPDVTSVVAEAYEMVERGWITEEDLRDFLFVNPVTLYAGTNPDFFRGTIVEDPAARLLASAEGSPNAPDVTP